jgi:hypothetical protein
MISWKVSVISYLCCPFIFKTNIYIAVAYMATYPQWDDQTRLRYDACARKIYDRQSMGTGQYIAGTPGYRWCESQQQYATLMTEPTHYQKVYQNSCQIETDSDLRFAPLTDPRLLHPLFARPYLGSYMGAGQRSLGNKDLETELTYGLDTRGGPRRACDVLSGVSIDRFQCLPEHGNPQRVQHVVEPWIRGGDNTRDYVRRVNYEAKCLNARTGAIANSRPASSK